MRNAVKPLILTLAVLITLVAAPAEAFRGRGAVEVRETSCSKPTRSEPWGGISVSLALDKRLPPKGEPYLVVVDDAEGHEVDRFFADAPRYRLTFTVAADGLAKTPDLVITASVGGDLLGSARVLRNCGRLNPSPPQPPVVAGVRVVGCDVSVTVRNPSDEADTIVVALWPQGSNVAPMRAVDLPAAATGSVTFEAQVPGVYSADVDSVRTFLSSETPFDILVPEGCAAA